MPAVSAVIGGDARAELRRERESKKSARHVHTRNSAQAEKAEAERERRAKFVAAEGKYQAAMKLGQAADIITQHPVALQLRTLQTMFAFAAMLELRAAPDRRESQCQGPMPEALMAQLQVLRLLRISKVRRGAARSNTHPAFCIS